MAGGIGAKKVDVTWATEEAGLLLGISIKSINFRDQRTGNFQKNLTNRRGDMLFEAVTLHRRFPYAVLGGLFLLDASSSHAALETFLVGEPDQPIPMSEALDELLKVTAIRNPDFFEYADGDLVPLGG